MSRKKVSGASGSSPNFSRVPDDEVWRPVAGYEFYEVSSLGRVQSLDRKITKPHPKTGASCVYRIKGRVLKPRIHKNGYPTVQLPSPFGDGYDCKLISRLVCDAFHGLPEHMEADHIDLDPSNNRADNLRPLTLADNRARRIFPKGQSHWHSKLTAEQVRQIAESSGRQHVIAAKFGVSRSLVGLIRQGKHRQGEAVK